MSEAPATRSSRRRWPLLLVWLVGVTLYLPALWVPFDSDDAWWVSALDQTSGSASEPYCFYDARHADLPERLRAWWMNPRMSVCFWRPLSGASLALDHALFGHHPVGYVADSLLCWAFLLAAVLVLLVRVGRVVAAPEWVAAVAGLLFAVHRTRVELVAWVSARHQLLSASGVVLAALAGLAYRQQHRRRDLLLAWGSLAAALAAGESGLLGVLALVVLGAVRPRPRPTLAVGALAIGAAYLALYWMGGWGAHVNFGYFDAHAPARWLVQGPWHALREAGLALGLPPQVAAPNAPLVLPLLTVIVLSLSMVAAVSDRRMRVALLLLAGSLAPAALGPVCDRSALLPSLVTTWMVAVVVMRVGLPARSGVIAFLVLAWVAADIEGMSQLRRSRQRLSASAVRSALAGAERLVIIDTQGRSARDVQFLRQVVGLPSASSTVLDLVPGKGAHRVSRLSERAFAVDGEDLLRSPWADMARRPGLWSAGDVVRTANATVRVERATGARVERIVVTLDRSLDDPTQELLVWRDGAFERVQLASTSAPLEVPAAP